MLSILENSSTRMVVEQSAPNMLFAWITAALSLVLALFMLFNKRWVLGALMIALAIGMTVLATAWPAYRMTLNRRSNTISWSAVKHNKQVSYDEVQVADVNSAQFEFNRDARCIVLVLKDGSPTYPLGRQHFSGEPQQYIVLNAIREVIGQVPGGNAP